MESIN
jgi:hypothetical protein